MHFGDAAEPTFSDGSAENEMKRTDLTSVRTRLAILYNRTVPFSTKSAGAIHTCSTALGSRYRVYASNEDPADEL
jgi:hypothetical protein